MIKKQARNTQPAKPAGMKKLEHRGYVIVQSPRNHHVMIGKEGRTVYHASYTTQLTEEELRQAVDEYITVSEAKKKAATYYADPKHDPAPKSRKKKSGEGSTRKSD